MEIIRDLDNLRSRPYPVVALGNFDGVHVGHQTILRTAMERAQGEKGTAFVLTFDPNPAKVLAPDRAPRLIQTSADKLEILRTSGIDGVLLINFTRELSQLTPREFVRAYLVDRVGVRTIVVGHSVSFGHNRAGNAALMTELGREFDFEVIVIGPVNVAGTEVSSTKVREVIAAGDLRTAAKLLGRPHFLSGPVVHGRERGRKIGFPTANIQSRTEILPPDGVYATRLILDDGPHASITNIGMRPTFAEPERTIEAHVFDFDRDLYDQEVRLELIERIRPERKFDSGIASDLQRARTILSPS
jgi:riboflavin kinase / FMN adenylyltransferase